MFANACSNINFLIIGWLEALTVPVLFTVQTIMIIIEPFRFYYQVFHYQQPSNGCCKFISARRLVCNQMIVLSLSVNEEDMESNNQRTMPQTCFK